MKFFPEACILMFLTLLLYKGETIAGTPNLVVSLLEYLREENSNSSDCLLYQPIPTAHTKRFTQKFLQSFAFVDVPVLIQSRHFVTPPTSIRIPPLVIVVLEHLDQISKAEIENVLKSFHRLINCVVVFRWTTQAQFDAFEKSMSHYKIFYIAIDETRDYFSPLSDQTDEPIVHMMKNSLTDDPIAISAIEHYPYVAFQLGPPTGIDVATERILAEKLNRSIEIRQFYCLDSESYPDCMERKISQSNEFTIHLDRTTFRNTSLGYVPVPTPFILVIIVPFSGSISMMQLMAKPFQTCLSSLIICTSIGFAIIMRRFPNHFRNNLILLPWCGFESYNLHRTGRLERFTMIGLILLTFFIRSVFENKLTAIITSWTLRSEVNSIEELLEAGWTIQSDEELQSKTLMADARWKNAIQYQRLDIDGSVRQAYVATSRLYQTYNMLWKEMDLRFTLQILPEQFCLGYGMYYFGSQHELADQFEDLQRRVFETGIYTYWDDLFQTRLYRYFQDLFIQPTTANSQVEETSMILWSDLKSLRQMLLRFWVVSGVVFLLEIICSKRRFPIGEIKVMRPLSSKIQPLKYRRNTFPNEVVHLRNKVNQKRNSI